jgi:hypothetical protein
MNESSPVSRHPIRSPAATDDKEQQVALRRGSQVPGKVSAEPASTLRSALLHDNASVGAVDAVPEVDGLPDGSAVLVVKRGPNAGARFPLKKPVTSAGRDPYSDIFLDEVTASRRHAEFRLENGEFRVVDVGSLNGTYVNREPVDSAVLANGDEIQLGKYRLVFLTRPTTG